VQEQEEGVYQVSGEQSGSVRKPEQSLDRGVEISKGVIHGTKELVTMAVIREVVDKVDDIIDIVVATPILHVNNY